MISFFLSDWFVARFLDAVVKGEDIPDTMAVYGIALLVAAASTLTALITRAVIQGRLEDDDEPEMEASVPAADVTAEIPRFVADRMARERRGAPSPRSRSRLVAHEGMAATVVIPTVYGADPDATAELTLVERPRRHRR